MYYPTTPDYVLHTFKRELRYKNGDVTDQSFSSDMCRRYVSSKPAPVKGRFTNGWRYPTTYRRGVLYADEPYGFAIWSSYGGTTQNRYDYYSEEIPGWSADELLDWSTYLRYGAWNMTGVTPPQNMRARVDTEILNKLASGNLNLGVAIAESRETVSMLSRNVIALVRAYSAARRGNWRQVFTQLGIGKHRFKAKDISSRWLEISFGWKPLISDIHAAYELLSVKLTERMPMRAVRLVTSSESWDNTATDSTTLLKKRYYKEIVSRKATLWFYINDSRLAWASSLGLLNPAVIVWEKVPFSFLVDWLIPVGNLLEACTNTLGLTFLSGTYTDKSTASGKTTWTYKNQKPTKSWVGSFEQTFSATQYSRETLSSFPLPRPYYKSPLSTGHAILALALIHQRMRF